MEYHFFRKWDATVPIKWVNLGSGYHIHWMKNQGKKKTLILFLARGDRISALGPRFPSTLLSIEIFGWLKYCMLLCWSQTRHQHLLKTLLYLDSDSNRWKLAYKVLGLGANCFRVVTMRAKWRGVVIQKMLWNIIDRSQCLQFWLGGRGTREESQAEDPRECFKS